MSTSTSTLIHKSKTRYATEVRLLRLRESPMAADAGTLDVPEAAVKYWREHVATAPWFNSDVESFVVLHLNSRKRAINHVIVSTGTLDTLLVHPREVFKVAIVANSAAILLMHNHPSGDPCPSEGDIKVTRDLVRAGQLLKIEVLDHVIMGQVDVPTPGARGWSSLRELEYFLT
jgi:DNA repair protein RadC